YGDPRRLHSFPTRRSSDLDGGKAPVLGRSELVTLTVDENGTFSVKYGAEERKKNIDAIALGVDVGGATLSLGLLAPPATADTARSEEHTSELQSQSNLVCR